MKRFLILAMIVMIVAAVAVPALALTGTATVVYLNGCNTANATQIGASEAAAPAQPGGKLYSASVYPNGWQAPGGSRSTAAINITGYAPTRAPYNSTSGLGAVLNAKPTLSAVGYWTLDVTQCTASTATNLQIGVASTDVTGLPASTNSFNQSNGNKYAAGNIVGTFLTSTTTPVITFTENTNNNRWYVDQLRFTSATPGAPTLAYPAAGATNVPVTGLGNELSWNAGANNYNYDVYLDTNPAPTTLVASDLTVTSFDAETISGGLVAGTTYYWKVVGKNVGMAEESTVGSFTASATLAYTFTGIAVTDGAAGTGGGTVSGNAYWLPGLADPKWEAFPVSTPTQYYFMGWTEDEAGTVPITADNPWTIASPTGSRTFYGQFRPDMVAPTGTISINAGATYAHSYDVTLNLNATDTQSGVAQMQFSNDNSTWADYVPYAPTAAWRLDESTGVGEKTVYARFKDAQGNESEVVSDTIEVPPGWTLYVLPQSGQEAFGTPTPAGANIYMYNDPVVVAANPNVGYTFVNWTDQNGTVKSTNASYSFNMPNEDLFLYANYTAAAFTLTVNACTNGTVGGDSGSKTTGSYLNVTASANEFYKFKNWTTDGCGGTAIVSTDNPYYFYMPASDLTLSANFEYIPILTVAAGANGTVGGDASGQHYEANSDRTVTATPDAGFRFYGWSTDSAGNDMVYVSTSATDTSYTFKMPATDYTLYAQFVVPELLWRDNFEGTNLGVYTLAAGTVAGTISTAQKQNGSKSLEIASRNIRMYGGFGTNAPVGSKLALRYWIYDPINTGYGYINGIYDATSNQGLVLNAGPYNASANYATRTIGSTTQSAWADIVGATRLSGQWNRFDIYFDGANTAKYYINGILQKTVTDIGAGKQAKFVGIGNGMGAAVTAGYLDDMKVFLNPVLVTDGVQSGSGTTSYTVDGAAMAQSATGYYYKGEVVTLTATPAVGWDFVNWVAADGTTVVSTDPTYTFTVDATDVTAKAVFARNAGYDKLTLVAVPAGGGSVPAEAYYPRGTAVTLTSTPRKGFRLLKWSTNAEGTDTVASPYTINGDTTLYGIFQFRAFSESFESYSDGADHSGGDIDMQGAVNSSANGNLNGNPWFGAVPVDGIVYGAINSLYPHSGTKMLISGSAFMNDQNAVNLAYRVNNGQPFTGDVYMDWWFCDRLANNQSRDYAGLTFYADPMCSTAGQDYNFSDAKLYTHLTQFLAIGCADIDDTANPPAGYDATKYQIRMIGDPTGYASGPSNYSTGWSNTSVARAAGWHHFKIVVGPANPDNTNEVKYFIDDMVTPVATKTTTTTVGINSLSVYSKTNTTTTTYSTSCYVDEIQFGKAGTESIDNWSVIGHYAQADKALRFSTDFFAAGTEGATEATIAAKTGVSYNGKLWGLRKGGMIDFNRYYNNSYTTTYTENGVSYLFAYINNSGAAITDALMSCGSDDGIKVFLNGAEIYANDASRGLQPDQDYAAPFTIPAGISRLLVKVSNGTSAYGAQVRITHQDGSALTGVTYIASDDVAPTGGSIAINGGAVSTGSHEVTLNLTAAVDALNAVTKMQFSDDGTTYGAPVAFASSVAYTLAAGDGEKTVYVKFIDAAGNVSDAVSDTIVVSSGPQAPPANTAKAKIIDLWPLANDGTTVYGFDAANAKTVSAVWTDGFWIEETSRYAGIKVQYAAECYKYFDDSAKTAVQAGDVVDIYGTLTVTAGKDRVFVATYVRDRTIGAGTAIKPLAMTQKFLVGKQASVNTPGLPTGTYKAVYNAGLFVKLAGSVVGTSGANYFFLDDKTESARTGIKVYFGGTIPTSGNKVVTGAVGMEGNLPVIYATSVQ